MDMFMVINLHGWEKIAQVTMVNYRGLGMNPALNPRVGLMGEEPAAIGEFRG